MAEEKEIEIKTKDTVEKKSKRAKEKIEEKGKVEKKKDFGKDFKYIVRLSNTDIKGEKSVVYGLTAIKGIGFHMACLIADRAGVERFERIGNLDDKKIETIQSIINELNKNAPSWMLNHRREYDSGEDIHVIGADVDMKIREEINLMKKIRCYRGIRHELGLPVRGQRTRSNGRKGLALGVSRKKT